jgi:hypothetical protein
MTDMDWKEIDRETTLAEEITTLRKELAEARAALAKMHRRAQISEGKLARMEKAHADACRSAFAKYIDYYAYGWMLLNSNPALFPKSARAKEFEAISGGPATFHLPTRKAKGETA